MHLRSPDRSSPSSRWLIYSLLHPCTLESPPKVTSWHSPTSSLSQLLLMLCPPIQPPQTALVESHTIGLPEPSRVFLLFTAWKQPSTSAWYPESTSAFPSRPHPPPAPVFPYISLPGMDPTYPAPPPATIPASHQCTWKPDVEVRGRAPSWIQKQRMGPIKGVRMCHPKICHFDPRIILRQRPLSS